MLKELSVVTKLSQTQEWTFNVPPKLQQWYLTERYSLSHPHYVHHTKYMQKVDKPMIYAMIGSEADIRELIW